MGTRQRRTALLGSLTFCLLILPLWSYSFTTPQGAPPVGPGHGTSSQGPLMTFAPSIQAIAVTENEVVYAGSFGMGVFRSDNRVKTWLAVNSKPLDPFILCLETDKDGTVYAGTVRGGVFRTRDGGTTWTAMSQGMKRVEVKSLLIHKSGLYAGRGRGVYRWIEHDQHWIAVAEGLDQTLVPALVMLGDRMLVAGTAGKGLFFCHSTKAGRPEWRQSPRAFVDPKERLGHKFIRMLAVDKTQQLYLGTQDGGLFRSADQGVSWRSISRSLPNDSIRGIVSVESGLLVATGRGIFKTVNQGNKWIPINTGLTELSIQALTVSEQGALYAGTSAGAFRSDDVGGHWVNISQGFGEQHTMPRPYQ